MADFRTLGLLFYSPDEPGALAGPPAAAIYLQTFSTGQFPGWETDTHRMTPVEHTPEMFDAWADRLIENINELKKEARLEFQKATTGSDSHADPQARRLGRAPHRTG